MISNKIQSIHLRVSSMAAEEAGAEKEGELEKLAEGRGSSLGASREL